MPHAHAITSPSALKHRAKTTLTRAGEQLSFRGLVQQSKLGKLDLNKLEEVFLSARGLQKGEAKTEHVTLSLEDFTKVFQKKKEKVETQ